MAKTKRRGPKYKWDGKSRPIWTWLSNRRCAQCWGDMKDRKDDEGEYELYCPNECHPGGHVSAEWIEIQRQADQIMAEKVANRYPHLDGAEEFVYPDQTEEELEEGSKYLFSE